MKKSAFLLFAALTTSAYADFSVQLDAGRLRQDAANAMAAGSLLILIEAGGDNSFSNNLAPGQYVSGNDILLSATAFPNSAQPFNTSGGLDETNNLFTDLSTANPGDLVALRWFPQITYAQWQAGATPTAGEKFGTYNPLTNGNGMVAPPSMQCPGGGTANSPDCGNAWAVPAGGVIDLNFFTTDSSGGGTQTPSEGYANFTVTSVPEPATWIGGLLASSVLGLQLIRRRRVVVR